MPVSIRIQGCGIMDVENVKIVKNKMLWNGVTINNLQSTKKVWDNILGYSKYVGKLLTKTCESTQSCCEVLFENKKL